MQFPQYRAGVQHLAVQALADERAQQQARLVARLLPAELVGGEVKQRLAAHHQAVVAGLALVGLAFDYEENLMVVDSERPGGAGGGSLYRNRLGIMVDLSHLNEAGFWDVAAISDAPLVATHSNVHAICAATRNLTERQLDAIRASEGIVGLNFNCGFLHPEGNR